MPIRLSIDGMSEQRGKVVVITGANQGIGAATARLLASQGYTVVVNYRRDHESAQRLVEEIHDLGGHAIAIQADIRHETEVVDLFAQVDLKVGRLDALVNNAGTLGTQMDLQNMSAARIEEVFQTNVVGTMICARETVLRLSRARGGAGGAIVNVSSAASRLGSAHEYIDYAASKGAVDTFTIGLAKEVAAQGIRVNAVRPGFIDTPIHARGGDPGRLQRLQASIPLQRWGEANEVAQAIAWLLSDAASYVTGAFIDVAGGR